MRIFIETPFSGIIRGKLLRVTVEKTGVADLTFTRAHFRITSRNKGRMYPQGGIDSCPLEMITPAECFAVARQRGSGKLYLRCTKTHNRAEMFAPYMES